MSVFTPESLVSVLAPLAPVGRVWVGYSGGLDSTVLLSAAAAVRERLPGALGAIHLDHGINPHSRQWGEHCRRVCEGLGIPLVVRRLALVPVPGESLEAVARAARYEAFSTLLSPGDLLLTAHNQDDQAETLLLALMRGSGVHGLAAMPRVADLGPGRLVRPLLDFPRAALAQQARTLGLTWVEDPSNRDLGLDRNYLRNAVIPKLRERWPSVSAALARSAGHCAEAAALVDVAAGRELVGLGGERPGTLSIPGLLRQGPALRKAVLRLWLRRRGLPVPDALHLGRILGEVLPARRDADPLVAWTGCEVRRYRNDLFALRPLPPSPQGLDIPWAGQTLGLPDGLGVLERVAEGGAPGAPAAQALLVRFHVPGLVCRPLGKIHRRPLKKLFQEAGIPAWLRPYVPLLFDGEGLVAIVGVCRCGPSAPVQRESVQVPDSPGIVQPVPGTPSTPAVRWRGHPWEELGLFHGAGPQGPDSEAETA